MYRYLFYFLFFFVVMNNDIFSTINIDSFISKSYREIEKQTISKNAHISI